MRVGEPGVPSWGLATTPRPTCGGLRGGCSGVPAPGSAAQPPRGDRGQQGEYFLRNLPPRPADLPLPPLLPPVTFSVCPPQLGARGGGDLTPSWGWLRLFPLVREGTYGGGGEPLGRESMCGGVSGRGRIGGGLHWERVSGEGGSPARAAGGGREPGAAEVGGGVSEGPAGSAVSPSAESPRAVAFHPGPTRARRRMREGGAGLALLASLLWVSAQGPAER